MRVGDPTEQPASERPHEEPNGENAGCGQQLAGLVSRRKERGREVDRGKGVSIEIIPLDQISGRGRHDRLDTRKLLRRAIGEGFRFRYSYHRHLDLPKTKPFALERDPTARRRLTRCNACSGLLARCVERIAVAARTRSKTDASPRISY